MPTFLITISISTSWNQLSWTSGNLNPLGCVVMFVWMRKITRAAGLTCGLLSDDRPNWVAMMNGPTYREARSPSSWCRTGQWMFCVVLLGRRMLLKLLLETLRVNHDAPLLYRQALTEGMTRRWCHIRTVPVVLMRTGWQRILSGILLSIYAYLISPLIADILSGNRQHV
jgi:hypothetical protein